MRLSATLLLAFAVATPLSAGAQQATEQFIPIGKSPGLSPSRTYRGPIEAVNPATRTLVVAGREIGVDDATWIWLDRSALGQSNLRGGLSDCQPGRSVEIHFRGPERRSAAWIKVRAESRAPAP